MKHKLPVIFLSITVIALLISNIYTFSIVESYRQQLAGASHPTETPTQNEAAPSYSFEDAVSQEVVPGAAANSEESIASAAEQFLVAYYCTDTNQAQEEYLAGFDGLITEHGLQNMSEFLSRPSGQDSQVRLERNLAACKVYIRTSDAKNATAFCIAYVQEKLTVMDNPSSLANDPILIRLELKSTGVNDWKVNFLSFERSMSTLSLDLSSLLS